jgi:hypothetical protein
MSAMDAERRCPSCGALASADAAWCGQCYASLAEAPASRAMPPPATALAQQPTRADGDEPRWPCPVCGHSNPIQVNLCLACGTPFARLFQEAELAPEVAPRAAALWSLLLPGLGQWKCGRSLDGIARMVSFVFPFGTMLILVVSRLGRGGLGPATSLFSLFLVASLIVWATSVIDAYRVASGIDPLVAPRTLLWGLIGLILIAMGLATAVALPAARGR